MKYLTMALTVLLCLQSALAADATVDWDAEYQELIESDPGVLKKIESGAATKEEVIEWLQRTHGERKAAKQTKTGKNKGAKRLTAFHQKLNELTASGKLTKAEATELAQIMSEGDVEIEQPFNFKELAAKLKAAVKAGEMTRAEAEAAFKRAAQKAGKSGNANRSKGTGRGKRDSGVANFYAIVIGRLKTKDIELGEFTMEVDHVSSMYSSRWVKDEIVGKQVTVTGVSGQFLDKLLQIRRGKTLKVRSSSYEIETKTLRFGQKFHVLEETAPFKAEDFGVPPNEFRGFRGLLHCKIVEVGGYEVLLAVDDVVRVSKESKAADVDSIKGKRVRVVGFFGRHKDAFNELHVGDAIRVSVDHRDPSHDELTVTDLLENVSSEASE